MIVLFVDNLFFYSGGQLVSCTKASLAALRLYGFYRAMHFSAKRGIAIACRLSVRPSVCDVG